MPVVVSDISSYVRKEWAGHGVEVQAAGVRTLTLLLPPDLKFLTELCVELWTHFGASTDFKHAQEGSTLTVWLPTTSVDEARPRGTTFSYIMVGCVVAAASTGVVLLNEARCVLMMETAYAYLF